jgi:hypothetical protein
MAFQKTAYDQPTSSQSRRSASPTAILPARRTNPSSAASSPTRHSERGTDEQGGQRGSLSAAAAGAPGLLRAEPAGPRRPNASRRCRRTGGHQPGPLAAVAEPRVSVGGSSRRQRENRRACGLGLGGGGGGGFAPPAAPVGQCVSLSTSSLPLAFHCPLSLLCVFLLSLCCCFAVLDLLRSFFSLSLSFAAPEAGIILSTRAERGCYSTVFPCLPGP